MLRSVYNKLNKIPCAYNQQFLSRFNIALSRYSLLSNTHSTLTASTLNISSTVTVVGKPSYSTIQSNQADKLSNKVCIIKLSSHLIIELIFSESYYNFKQYIQMKIENLRLVYDKFEP